MSQDPYVAVAALGRCDPQRLAIDAAGETSRPLCGGQPPCRGLDSPDPASGAADTWNTGSTTFGSVLISMRPRSRP